MNPAVPVKVSRHRSALYGEEDSSDSDEDSSIYTSCDSDEDGGFHDLPGDVAAVTVVDAVVPQAAEAVVSSSGVTGAAGDSAICPLCSKSFVLSCGKPPQALWQHINSVHITRSLLPLANFIIVWSVPPVGAIGCIIVV